MSAPVGGSAAMRGAAAAFGGRAGGAVDRAARAARGSGRARGRQGGVQRHHGGLVVITFLLFTGFLLTKPNIPAWWIWMYYVNPLQYGVTAICINEFLSGSYNEVSGP
ncbi:hypothetical protein CLOP_g325 [Closterium sp. NIES-67]|nr:hypothetical protein CLOP_g325 [Closterium sp. NIES-67]